MAAINKIVNGAFDLTNALKNTGYKTAKQLEQEKSKQILESKLSNVSKSLGLSGSFKESTVTTEEIKQRIAQENIKKQQEELKRIQKIQTQGSKISKNVNLSGNVSISKSNVENEYSSPNFNINKQNTLEKNNLSSTEKEVNSFLGKDIPNYEDVVDKPEKINDFSHMFKNNYSSTEENFSNSFKEVKPSNKLQSGGNNLNTQSGPKQDSSQDLSFEDFINNNSNNSPAYTAMNKRLSTRFNEIDSKIKAIKDDKDLSNIDKTKQINDIYSSFGDNVKNMHDVKRSLIEQAKQGPTIRDYAIGYKVPQAITGVTLLGGMASMTLGNSKGQKTNAELYSNPF